MAVFKEERGAGITTLDGAIEVVPLVDHANGVGWKLHASKRVQAFVAGDFAEKGEGPVEDAALVR